MHVYCTNHTCQTTHLYHVLKHVHLVVPCRALDLTAILVNKVKAHQLAVTARIAPPVVQPGKIETSME
jgi:hypothetical protein